jgi:hypothetical protein
MPDTLPTLLPAPRELQLTGGNATLPNNALIVIPDRALRFEAQTAQRALADHAKLNWEIVAGNNYAHAGLTLLIVPGLLPQGYRLSIANEQITIQGADVAGVFYGVCTLRQLLLQYSKNLPALTINDWPDYPARGVMLDISRDKVPTLQTVLDLVDRLASWKINQVQLYMEHTFAYQAHPEVWAHASPFTGQEILELDAFCRQRHVELVPNQNSLGHMERWLKHPRYAALAEAPDGFEPPWGGHSAPTTLDPLDPGSLALIRSLYDELLPHFSSRTFNAGLDEPWELGKGKSQAAVEARGGRVYLEYVLKLHRDITRRGRQMQFWADIIMHYPDLVPELPKDITAMLWGYEGGEQAAREWERQCAIVRAAGVPMYVCPGTSSWNTLVGRTDNTLDNLRIAAAAGLKHGAIGYLNTDWGDAGHWQPLPISYLGFAYGAGIAWCYATNEGMDVPRVLDRYAFEDRAGVMGRLAYDLGEVYKLIGPEHINGQILFYSLQRSRADLDKAMQLYEAWGGGKADTWPETLRAALHRINAIMQPLENAAIQRADADLIAAEYVQVADLMRHSAQRLLWIQGQSNRSAADLRAELEQIIARQRTNWLARNRSGGLEDSIQRFDAALKDYQGA